MARFGRGSWLNFRFSFHARPGLARAWPAGAAPPSLNATNIVAQAVAVPAPVIAELAVSAPPVESPYDGTQLKMTVAFLACASRVYVVLPVGAAQVSVAFSESPPTATRYSPAATVEYAPQAIGPFAEMLPVLFTAVPSTIAVVLPAAS